MARFALWLFPLLAALASSTACTGDYCPATIDDDSEVSLLQVGVNKADVTTDDKNEHDEAKTKASSVGKKKAGKTTKAKKAKHAKKKKDNTWSCTGDKYYKCSGVDISSAEAYEYDIDDIDACEDKADDADATSFAFTEERNGKGPFCVVDPECDSMNGPTTRPWQMYALETSDGTGCCVWNADGTTCGGCGTNNGNWCHLSESNCGKCGGSYYADGATPSASDCPC